MEAVVIYSNEDENVLHFKIDKSELSDNMYKLMQVHKIDETDYWIISMSTMPNNWKETTMSNRFPNKCDIIIFNVDPNIDFSDNFSCETSKTFHARHSESESKNNLADYDLIYECCSIEYVSN